MSFSERYGYSPVKLDLKLEEIPASLKNGLWDAALDHAIYPFKDDSNLFDGDEYTIHFYFCLLTIYQNYLNYSQDSIPKRPDDGLNKLKEIFFLSTFPRFYDLIENIYQACEARPGAASKFSESCNLIFEREKAALRFVSGRLTKVTEQQEIEEVNRAAENDFSNGVAQHISRAIELYSDRNQPDYRNSIKESISAVEAAAKQIAGDAKLIGDAPKRIERSGQLHPALRNGLSNLYGWTSDANGIRHAIMDKNEISEHDARFMLVICSAFSNYLMSKNSES